MKTFSESIFDKARSVLTASKSLDYKGIVNSDEAAVVKLKEVLKQLSIGASNESLGSYASKQGTLSNNRGADNEQTNDIESVKVDQNEIERQAAESRRLEITATIVAEGLESRLGKVYNSFANDRVMKFEDIPHSIGLPPFDIVFAADYSPLSGLHGIFISADKVMSIILASDAGSSATWDVFKSKSYSNQGELMEYVTLLSAGFELP